MADSCTPSGLRSSMQDLRETGCQIEKMSADCQGFFYQNPELIEFSKNCSIENDKRNTIHKWFDACKDAGIEAWTGIWQELDKAGKAIDACNENINCKKEIARQAFFFCKNQLGQQTFPCTDVDELAQVDIRDLLRKRDHVRDLANKDPSYRQKILEQGAVLPNQDDGPPLEELIQASLSNLGIQAQCFNSVGYVRMGCYVLASLVDPTMAVEGLPLAPLVGVKWLRAVLKGARLERAAVRTEESVVKTVQLSKKISKGVISTLPDNLYDVPIPKTLRASREQNAQQLSLLKKYSSNNSAGRVDAIDKNDAQKLFQKVKEHPVVGNCALPQYDPGGDIGFCFGRSSAFVVESLRTGVGKDSIKKAFVYGDLKDSEHHWGYHVITLVKSKSGGWWAFDPIKFNGPVSIEEWHRRMTQMSPNKPFNLLFTEYRRTLMNRPDAVYRFPRANKVSKKADKYFKDYIDSVREEIKDSNN